MTNQNKMRTSLNWWPGLHTSARLSVLCVLVAGCVTVPRSWSVDPRAPAAPVTAADQGTDTSAVHFAEQDATSALVQAVDARLEIMRDVAAAKWISGAPIHDAAREDVVAQQVARRAQALGLDPVTTQAFFAAQVRLARVVQERWHLQWKAAGHCAPCDEPAPLPAVRERIDIANERQLAALYVAAPLRDRIAAEFTTQMRAALMRHSLATADADELEFAAMAIRRTTDDVVLARVRATRRLRIATTGDYAPFSLESNGLLTGADIELARQLAAHLGADAVFVRTSWPGLLDDLRAGRFDVAMSGISHTPERAALGLYSVPYHAGGKTLLARCVERERFDTPAELDLAGNRVIVNPGGTNEGYVREHVTRAQVIVHPDNRTVFAEIAARRADVMVTDDVEAELQARRWPGQLCRTYPGTLTHGEKRILMARDAALQSAVDAWLRGQIAAGEPARRLEDAVRDYVDAATAR